MPLRNLLRSKKAISLKMFGCASPAESQSKSAIPALERRAAAVERSKRMIFRGNAKPGRMLSTADKSGTDSFIPAAAVPACTAASMIPV